MKRIKLKTSKLTRILISIVATALVVGSIALGATAVLSDSEEMQPVVLQFNNEEAINELYFNESTGTLYTGEDGRTALSTTMTDQYSSFVEFPGTLIPEVNLASYPFVVIHANQGSDCGIWTDLYWDSDADGSFQWEEFQMSTAGEWTKTVLDMSTRTYYNYAGDELLGSGAIQSAHSDIVWQGNLTQLRFNFSTYVATTRTSLVEYIGFFPTKEAALAYDGAMPNDALATTAAEALSEEVSVVYAQAETEAVAKKYLQDTFADKVEAICGDVKHSVVVKDITDYSVDVSGGTFTAKTWIYVGEGLQQSLLVTDVACRVEAKPAPVVVKFDSQDVVDAMNIYYDDETLESTFVDDETPHLSWTVSSSGWCDPAYMNFLDMSGQSDTFTYDAYPYMKILYRRNVSASKLSGERTELYIDSDANDSYSNYSFNLYKLAEGEEPYWEALVADMRGTTVRFFQDGTETGTGEFTPSNDNKWSGNPVSTRLGVPIRFDFTRQGTAERTMDVAYVGFFASEAEAIAYPDVLDFQATADANKLREHCNFTGHNSLDTQEIAHAYAEEYIESLNFTSAYALTSVEFAKPTLEAQGQYLFDVTFAETEVVRCTMTIDKQVEPVIYTFDNASSIKNFSRTNNVTLSIENGCMKMQTIDPSAADGFYTEANYPNYAPTFEVSTRRYFKAKYQLSGIADVPKDQMLTEIYYQLAGDSAYYWRDSYMVSAEMNGNTIEIIMDLGATDPASNRTWVKAGDDSYVAGTMLSNDTIRYEGDLSYFRFNPARVATAENRTAYVQYMGFFGSLDEAQTYDGDDTARTRIQAAKDALQGQDLQIEWGYGNTEEKAVAKAKELIQSDLDCRLENIVYKQPTQEEPGSVVCDVVLCSGGIEETLEGLTVSIETCPEPIVWRFNDPDKIDKLTFHANVDATIENNLLKMVHKNPEVQSGFEFSVDTVKNDERFYLQNYPYIMMKYKRSEVAPARIEYDTDELSWGTFFNDGRIGLGPEKNQWYTTILDTTVTDYEQPIARNYNRDTPGKNWNYYTKVGFTPYANNRFYGLSKKFTFNFGSFPNLERTAYIEYIAFFPTLEAALAYDEAYESAKSNTEVALRNYAGETVSYYEGNTEEAAKAKAKGLIDKLLLDDVRIDIQTISYEAPKPNEEDGEYQFTASIYKDEQLLYTTKTCTLTIEQEKEREKVVYMFTNPDFVSKIKGSTPTVSADYSSMILGDNPYFAYEFGDTDTSIKLYDYTCITLGVKNITGSVTLKLNDKYTFTSSALSSFTGNLSFVFDSANGTYTVYKDNTEDKSGTMDELDTIANEKIDQIQFNFEGSSAEVTYMEFSPEASLDNVFDPTALPEVLEGLGDITGDSCRAGDASTEARRMALAKKSVLDAIGENVKVVQVNAGDYTEPTVQNKGSYTCDVWVSSGEIEATYYKKVSVTISINEKPSEPVMLDLSQEPRYTSNLETIYENGVLHTTTIKPSVEDSFIEYWAPKSGIYLSDYPYISFKFKRTGSQSSSGFTGDSQIYFWNDAITGNPAIEFSLGDEDLLGETWVTAIINMNDGMITLYDMNNEKIYRTVSVTGELHNYIGSLTHMRITMARNITVDRTADIAYFGFFPTLESAQKYMGGLYINKYTNFTGSETAVTTQALETAPKTFEMAVRIDESVSTAMTLLSNQTDNFALKTTATGAVELTYGGNVVATTENSIYTGKWTYVTVTVDNNEAKIYLNGVEDGASSSGITISNVSWDTLVIGGGVSGTDQFRGDMANIKLYSVAKEASEIAAFDYSMPYGVEDNMIAGWSLGNLLNDNTFKEVGEKYTLEFVNPSDKKGHEFTGSDYITTEADLTEAPKTYESWIKISKEQLSGTYTLLSNKTDSSENDITIQLVDGCIVAYYNGALVLESSDLNIVPSKWTHIALTFGEKAKLYKDGTLHTTGEVNVSTDGVSTEKVYIGATNAESKKTFEGCMTDIRLWNSVLTEDVISQKMNHAPASEDEGLIAAWRLEQQVYLEYTDYSGNQNTAKLYSDGWYKLENITSDYMMLHVADTQNLLGYGKESIYYEMMDWVADNITTLNIKHLMHLGDVTQRNTIAEWEFARKGFDKIEGKVPYTIALGNHDYPTPSHGIGAEIRDETNFNTFFPYEDYMAGYTDSAKGGAFKENDSTNVYKCITVGEIEYMIFAIEFGPRDEVLDWVSEVLNREENRNKKAIITTHSYFDANGELSTFNAQKYGEDFQNANEGIDIWYKLVAKHPNIVMVSCGHSMGQQTQQRLSKNNAGGDVLQVLADPSDIGGFPASNGLLLMYAFTNDGTIHTYYYSPSKDMYYGTVNECTWDMSTALGISQ